MSNNLDKLKGLLSSNMDNALERTRKNNTARRKFFYFLYKFFNRNSGLIAFVSTIGFLTLLLFFPSRNYECDLAFLQNEEGLQITMSSGNKKEKQEE